MQNTERRGSLKVRINVGDESYEKVEQMLRAAGFEIDDDAELVISERDHYSTHIAVKTENGEKIRINTSDIVFIESFGHDVVVHSTDSESYHAYDRLYQLVAELDNEKFIRVSNCAIVAKGHIRKIKPSLSMKFVLVMSDGSLVDVTRSYYNSFREFIGI